MSKRLPPPALETQLIHAGEPRPRICGAVIQPIFQSATFEYGGEKNYHDLKYIRLNNTPTHTLLHKKLAALEGGEDALSTASGMAAISTTLLTILKPGDHFLAQSCLYGGTRDLIDNEFADMGIAADFIDASAPETWARLLRPGTKAIYVESMSNPILDVGDLKAVVRFARKNGLLSLIDNTFTSPVNFQPLALGYDLSLHSATKYLNGHSDIVAGAVIGGRQLVTRIKYRLDHLGGCLDPHAAFLLLRGLKTLSLRVERQNENSLALARFLNSHRKVRHVNHPGLPGHPAHARAKSLFKGFGGMLSIELAGGARAADRMMKRLVYAAKASSLGGVETLVTRPATTSHAGTPRAARLKMGITDSLVRVSVGVENAKDLIADFGRALS